MPEDTNSLDGAQINLPELFLLVVIGLHDWGKHMVGGIVFYRHIF